MDPGDLGPLGQLCKIRQILILLILSSRRRHSKSQNWPSASRQSSSLYRHPEATVVCQQSSLRGVIHDILF